MFIIIGMKEEGKAKKKPNLKRIAGWILTGIFSFLSFVIIFESSLPASLSAAQSSNFGEWIANIINSIKSNDTSTNKVIEQAGLFCKNNEPLLGFDEDNTPLIAAGTTHAVTFTVGYASKNTKDSFDKTFTVEKEDGSDFYVLPSLGSSVRNGKKNEGYAACWDVNVRIIPMTTGDFSFTVKGAGELNQTYSFKSVVREKPADDYFALQETNYVVDLGKTARLERVLVGPESSFTNGKEGAALHKYLSCYFDLNKVDPVSFEGGTIDSFGVIHPSVARDGNPYVFSYHGKEISVEVRDSSIVLPAVNPTLSITSSKQGITYSDHDYSGDEYTLRVAASFGDEYLGEKDCTFVLFDDPECTQEDLVRASIVGQGIDESGNPYCDIQGYRSQKDGVYLKAVSTVDDTKFAVLPIEYVPNLPKTMTIDLGDNLDVYVGNSVSINATWDPLNVAIKDKKIHVEAIEGEEHITISGDNTTYPSIAFVSKGNATIKISSVSNPSLSTTRTFKIQNQKAVDSHSVGFAKAIRKGFGHFLLFAITALTGFIGIYLLIDDWKKIGITISISLGVCALLAFLSEFIQTFAPKRAGLLQDVGIDCLGALSGFIVPFLVVSIIAIIKKVLSKRKEKDVNQP